MIRINLQTKSLWRKAASKRRLRERAYSNRRAAYDVTIHTPVETVSFFEVEVGLEQFVWAELERDPYNFVDATDYIEPVDTMDEWEYNYAMRDYAHRQYRRTYHRLDLGAFRGGEFGWVRGKKLNKEDFVGVLKPPGKKK